MPRLTSISDKQLTSGSKKTPIFIKVFSGTDFTSYHSTWTFSTGTVSLVSSTLPYHSYGNAEEKNIPADQGCNKHWPLRAGTNADSGIVLSVGIVNGIFGVLDASSLYINAPVVFADSVAGVTAGKVYYVRTLSQVDDNFTVGEVPNGRSLEFTGEGNTTVTVGITTTANTNIGYWINGVNMYPPSAGSEVPNGYLAFPNLQYNAAYKTNLYYSFNLEQDAAGGRVEANQAYHYNEYSFGSSWVSGEGHVSGPVGTTGTAEVSLISYLGGSLYHADGHSKILGWSLDGYPVYGPYGYNQRLDCNSGVRLMKSSFKIESAPNRVPGRVADGVYDTKAYPMGIFVQDYYFDQGSGDLDISNGRFCVTPEYPEGTYAYFTPIDAVSFRPVYPYVIGYCFKSMPAPSGQTVSDLTDGTGSAPKQTS